MRLLHVEDGVDMGGASIEDIDQIPVYRFKSNKPPPPPPPRRPHPQLHHHQHQEITEPVKKQEPTSNPGFLDELWIRLGWMESPLEESQRVPVYYDEIEIPNEQDQVCAICLSTYEEGDILCRLWCYHHFHKTCVSEWLVLNSRCPLCKRDCRRQKDQQRNDLPSRVTTGANTTNTNATITTSEVDC